MHPNTMKMHQNMSLGSNGVDRVRSLPKIPMQFCGTNFALIAPVQSISHRVSCRNKTIENAPNHYKNAPIHEFSIQWGGSGAFIAKNSDAILWHELLH